MKFSKLHIFFIILLVLLWSAMQPKSTTEKADSSPSPLLSVAPSSQPETPLQKLNCLSEDEVEKIAGHKYTLLRENRVETAQLLSCKYEGNEQVKGINPVIEYFVSLTDNTQRWNEQRESSKTLSTYRTSANKEYLFAVLNPVIEVQNVQFYANKPPRYIELTYAPVNEDESSLLSKGEQLIEAVFSK